MYTYTNSRPVAEREVRAFRPFGNLVRRKPFRVEYFGILEIPRVVMQRIKRNDNLLALVDD